MYRYIYIYIFVRAQLFNNIVFFSKLEKCSIECRSSKNDLLVFFRIDIQNQILYKAMILTCTHDFMARRQFAKDFGSLLIVVQNGNTKLYYYNNFVTVLVNVIELKTLSCINSTIL